MPPAPIYPAMPERPSTSGKSSSSSRFSSIRGVRWRIDLGILPGYSASIDDLRRVAADSRRRYANMRRRVMIDPHIFIDEDKAPNLIMDNPLSQNPDSTWGRFFSITELERMLDQDLSRLYPEEGSYFQTITCQSMLRRILLVWCLMHPEYGYKQGMHELLAPLLYVIQVDVQQLSKVQEQYQDYINDVFHESSSLESDLLSSSRFRKHTKSSGKSDKSVYSPHNAKMTNLDDLDPEIREMLLMIDAYGAEGELGVIASEKFMEHDAYCMFDYLMSGSQGVVAMAELFSSTPSPGSFTGLPPVIEASIALYQLLAVVDPSLHSHLLELGVEPQYFALRWLRLLFGREFALEDILIIWDEIFSYPNSFFLEKAYQTELNCRILCSSRGAFISAMVVSMLVYLRFSLLGCDNATSCLQRLLNFPTDASMKELIDKAKALQPLALDNILTSCSTQRGATKSKAGVKQGHTSSFDFSATDGYWEEKWRVLNAQEDTSNVDHGDSLPTKIPKALLKEIFGLSRKISKRGRTKSADLPSEITSTNNHVKEDKAKSKQDFVGISEPKQSVPVGLDVEREHLKEQGDPNKPGKSLFSTEEAYSNVESSLRAAASPARVAHDHDYASEESSVASDSCVEDNHEDSIPYQKQCNNSTFKQANYVERNRTPEETYETGKEASAPKEQKTLSGELDGAQKFAGDSTEGKLEIGKTLHSQNPSDVAEHSKGNLTALASNEYSSHVAGNETRVENENLMQTLRSIGGSMLKNIQVIESVLVLDQDEDSSLDKNSKFNLGGEGRTAAIAALNELLKISNLLCDM